MKKHNAPTLRLLNRQEDYLPFTRDFRAPSDKTEPSAIYEG